jgi:hypothetical protein
MRCALILVVSIIIVILLGEIMWAQEFIEAEEELNCLFTRGDCNNDGNIDISDAVCILNFLYKKGAAPECLDSGDVNDDGNLDISDAIYVLNFLFLDGPDPPEPRVPGIDPTEDELGCREGDDNSACSQILSVYSCQDKDGNDPLTPECLNRWIGEDINRYVGKDFPEDEEYLYCNVVPYGVQGDRCSGNNNLDAACFDGSIDPVYRELCEIGTCCPREGIISTDCDVACVNACESGRLVYLNEDGGEGERVGECLDIKGVCTIAQDFCTGIFKEVRDYYDSAWCRCWIGDRRAIPKTPGPDDSGL